MINLFSLLLFSLIFWLCLVDCHLLPSIFPCSWIVWLISGYHIWIFLSLLYLCAEYMVFILCKQFWFIYSADDCLVEDTVEERQNRQQELTTVCLSQLFPLDDNFCFQPGYVHLLLRAVIRLVIIPGLKKPKKTICGFENCDVVIWRYQLLLPARWQINTPGYIERAGWQSITTRAS